MISETFPSDSNSADSTEGNSQQHRRPCTKIPKTSKKKDSTVDEETVEKISDQNFTFFVILKILDVGACQLESTFRCLLTSSISFVIVRGVLGSHNIYVLMSKEIDIEF